jgi:hypothetical protein
MRSPSQRFRPVRRALVGLAGLGAVFVLAVGLGAGVAIVSQGGVQFPGQAEPRQDGDPSGTGPLRADDTTTGIEDTRRGEETKNSGPSGSEEEASTSDHNIGVWYDAEAQRWTIFNQDLAPMPQGTSFDVHVLSDEAAFVHRATPENTVEDGTYLNNPLTNASPDAPSVTQNWNPVGVGGTYNDHPIGVRYDADVQQWVIFNEDGEAMPEGAAFNVTILPLEEPTFVQQATPGNVSENATYIDDPLVNGDPNAILFAIPRQREG